MVLAEKTNDDVRNGRRSRAASPNSHISEESNNTDDSDHQMRIGDAYQATIPDFISNAPCSEMIPEKALLVWAPNPDIPDKKLEDYITLAKEKYCYNAEQALGMLFWHKYSIEKAIGDLPNFSPFPDEWSVEDKVLFEQAFHFHGKSFVRIRQMIPDKSVASLVKYYYSWKKTRSRTSLMDRQARKLQSQKEDGSDLSEAPSENESDMDIDKDDVTKKHCTNCNSVSTRCISTPKGLLCNTCHDYWKKTGMLRNSGGPIRKRETTSSRYNSIKNKRKPPRNMYLNYDDLVAFATGPPGQAEAILRSMDSEVISFKRQVQNNKQIISQLKHKISSGIDHHRLPDNNKVNVRWTNDELLLAVQGVRKFGKDFKAIAEVIGNKNESHIKNFFTTHRRRYNLDAVLLQYEAENGITSEEEKEGDKAETDPTGPNSPTPAAEPPMLRPPPHPPLLQQVAPVRAQPPPLIRPAYNGIMAHTSQD